jgi:hypothetical protein
MLSPPVRLKAPPRQFRPFVAILWAACLALAVVAQAGQSWRVYEDIYKFPELYSSVGAWRFIIATQWFDVFVALVLLAAAAIFRVRRFKDPVAILVSFALLFLATVGTQDFWLWAGLGYVAYVLDGIWITLLLAAIPALPSGRYVPGWTRWLVLAGPVGGALLAFQDDTAQREIIRGLLILIVFLCVILRFRYTPRGAERQKMKWASLGLGAGLLLYAAGQGPTQYYGIHPASSTTDFALWMGGYAINRFAFIIMALGLLVSLLDYRLNDADAAIGRSTGYAAVTTLVAIVWAGSAAASDKLIRSYTGADNPGLAAGISTLIALAILAPARARALAWTEARFQGALVRLRSMPERIARWQLGDDPGAVANRALRAIADGVDATDAALIMRPEGAPPQVIGVHNIDPEAVMARLGEDRPRARKADAFPLRIEMADYAGGPLVLLIGPRSDGAFYTRQERSAVSAIAEPLADAVYAVSRRASLNATLTGALAEITARLDRMHGKSPRRRNRPGTQSPSR